MPPYHLTPTIMTAQTDPPRRAFLVTGAASGIGAATARRFIKVGWQVAINYAEASQHAAAAGIAAAATAPGQRAVAIEG